MRLAAGLGLLLLAAPGCGARPEDRFANYEGAKVHYRTIGNGDEAIVFVHGWACDAESWRRQTGAFPSLRVIAVDLPGHGRSGKPRADYSLDYFARSIAAVLRDAKVERAVLVGHSMGAPVVARFYGLHPDKTIGLVIVDGAMRPFMTKDEMNKTIRALRADYRSAAPAMIDSWLASVEDVKLRSDIRAAMLSTPDFVAISAFKVMADEKAYVRGPIRAPVLAVLAKSHGWTAADAAFLRSLAPRLESVTWNDVSHFLMMEKPTEFNATVSAFLSKNGLLARP